MSGVITDGWGYVAAAWGVSLAVLIGYTVAVNLVLRRQMRKEAQRAADHNDSIQPQTSTQ